MPDSSSTAATIEAPVADLAFEASAAGLALDASAIATPRHRPANSPAIVGAALGGSGRWCGVVRAPQRQPVTSAGPAPCSSSSGVATATATATVPVRAESCFRSREAGVPCPSRTAVPCRAPAARRCRAAPQPRHGAAPQPRHCAAPIPSDDSLPAVSARGEFYADGEGQTWFASLRAFSAACILRRGHFSAAAGSSDSSPVSCRWLRCVTNRHRSRSRARCW